MRYPINLRAVSIDVNGFVKSAGAVSVAVATLANVPVLIFDAIEGGVGATLKTTDANGDYAGYLHDTGVYKITLGTVTKFIFVGSSSSSKYLETTPVTASFTASVDDAGKYFVYDGNDDIEITIPEILTTDLGDGFTFCVDRKNGAGKVTFIEAVAGSVNLRFGDTLEVESGGVAQFGRRNETDNSASLFGALVQTLQSIKMQSIDIGPIPAITDHDVGAVFAVKADVAYKFDAHLLSNFNAAVTTDLLQLHINFPDAEYSMSSVFIPDQAGGAPQVQRKHSDDGTGLFVIVLRDSTATGCANVTGYIKPTADGDLSIGFLVTNNDPAQTADIKRGYITLTEVG